MAQTRLGDLTIWQPRTGYRFSMDSVLLASFASPLKGRVADLGAGCGVLGVLLSRRGLAGPFLALELDAAAAACCTRNFALHGLAGQVLNHDLTQPHPALAGGAFALVISNPPFGRLGHGRVPPDPARAAARHELTVSAEQLLAVAARLLKAKGRLALCAPPRRLPELLAALPPLRLAPRRLRLVHGRQGRAASLALIEAVKDGGVQLTVEPPLTVYGEGQVYRDEVARYYNELTGSGAAGEGREE
jgi:tRNA1Val (adenine37-N6)-methyltransferase